MTEGQDLAQRSGLEKVIAHLGSAAIDLDQAATYLGRIASQQFTPLRIQLTQAAAFYRGVGQLLAGEITNEEFEKLTELILA